MILKERDIPFRIMQNDALLRRLPEGHPEIQAIMDDQAKRKAGLRGEQNVSYHLTFLPDKYDIIHDIRLKTKYGQTFQIDSLVVSPYFFLSLETKNMIGTLYFEKYSKQFTRTINEVEEGFPNPIIQAERHQIQLKKWILERKLPILPIECYAVISNPATLIKSNEEKIYQKVFHAEHLPSKVKTFEDQYKQSICEKDYKRLTKTIIKGHTPLKQDVFEIYNLQKSEIRDGVQCPKCHSIPMSYHFGTWECLKCHSSSKTAYKKAVEDYLYLFGETITNQQCRNFLHLPSRHVVRELLLRMKLKQSGKTKNANYHW
ncbi:nuclease-related domain-containing protein [Robertmurraya massiliosenegalensis]|uniref:nuclease-related domain-containing protein n=1 Tax=Robertmurraya massiliosenegalensis TaxID=1287657 RepID=UPI00031AF241|nr:nuclease-related domain-containing protein [Robertmurraya massiliosenegalensis]